VLCEYFVSGREEGCDLCGHGSLRDVQILTKVSLAPVNM
jgi:hypothetical protein